MGTRPGSFKYFQTNRRLKKSSLWTGQKCFYQQTGSAHGCGQYDADTARQSPACRCRSNLRQVLMLGPVMVNDSGRQLPVRLLILALEC